MVDYKKRSKCFSRFAITRCIGLASNSSQRLNLVDISRFTGITLSNLSNAVRLVSSLSFESIWKLVSFIDSRFGRDECLRLFSDYINNVMDFDQDER